MVVEERGGEGGRRGRGEGGAAGATDEHGEAATGRGADEPAGCRHPCLLQATLEETRL